jgi:hypothetical protein
LRINQTQKTLMQVFGLPRQIIRTRAAVACWRRAMSDGLSADRAAQAVGVPRPTPYRWQKHATPKNRWPLRPRPKSWTHALRQTIERLRQDFPTWGRAKLGPLVREQGFAVSDATVGRIIADLVVRVVVEPVPALRRRPYAHRWTAKRRFARRLPRELAERARRPRPARHRLHKSHPGQGDQAFHRRGRPLCPAAASPQMNGAVERCNGAWRYEFYETYDLPGTVNELNPILDSY